MDEKRVGGSNSVNGSEYFTATDSDSLESSARFAGHGVGQVDGQALVNKSREESNIDQSITAPPVEIHNFTYEELNSIDHTQKISTVEECKQQIHKKQSYELTNDAGGAMQQVINALSEAEGDWSKVGDFTASSVSISVTCDGTEYRLIPPDALTKGLDYEYCLQMYTETFDLISEFQASTFDVNSYDQAKQVNKIDRFITTYEDKNGADEGLSAYNEVDVSLTIKGDFLTCNINSNAPQSLTPSSSSDEEGVDGASLLDDEVIVDTAQDNYNLQIFQQQEAQQLADLEKKLEASRENKIRFREEVSPRYNLKQIADIINLKLRGNHQQEIKISEKVLILNHDITKLGSKVIDNDSGNIPAMHVIANPAHPSLHRGSGACKAIWEAATGAIGSEKHIRLKAQCDSQKAEKYKRDLQLGEAVVTDGFDLCEYIVHTIGVCLSTDYAFHSLGKLNSQNEKNELFKAQIRAYTATLNSMDGDYNVGSTIMGTGLFKVDAYDSLSAAVVAMEQKDREDAENKIKLHMVYKEENEPRDLFSDIEIAIAKKIVEYNRKSSDATNVKTQL